MKRRIVRVVSTRLADVQVGDVINRVDDNNGWFLVASVTRLFDGRLQASDHTQLVAVSGADVDLVALQFVSEIDVPEQPVLDLPTGDADDEEEEGDEAGADASAAVPSALSGPQS